VPRVQVFGRIPRLRRGQMNISPVSSSCARGSLVRSMQNVYLESA
jgi:hypothetical protein